MDVHGENSASASVSQFEQRTLHGLIHEEHPAHHVQHQSHTTLQNVMAVLPQSKDEATVEWCQKPAVQLKTKKREKVNVTH